VNELIDLPPELRSVVEDELEVGESVLWSAQPRPGRMVWASLPIFLFAIPWTGFAVFWICGASGFQFPTLRGPAGLFPLFGLPFVLIGCTMLCAPLWAMRKAGRTLYVISDRRTILFEGGWSTTVRSFGSQSLGDITRKQRADGSGDIILERRTWRDNDGDRRTSSVGFYGIDNVKAVEALLRRLSSTVTTAVERDAQ
jgi:hypothetical protein